MLDLEDCRKAFADRLAQAADEKQSFERALMAACEFAYRRGLEDGREEIAATTLSDDIFGAPV